MLKVIIGFIMVALLGSLASGMYFLMADQGNPEKKRLFTSLGVRLSLGVTLIIVIIFGVATGELGHRNPWDAGPSSSQKAAEG
jgi:hypothetical protein